MGECIRWVQQPHLDPGCIRWVAAVGKVHSLGAQPHLCDVPEVQQVGASAFSGCSNLLCDLPGGVAAVGEGASVCRSLTSVTPEGPAGGRECIRWVQPHVCDLAAGVAAGGKAILALQEAHLCDLPGWVAGCRKQCIPGCSSLTSVTFPVGLQRVGMGAFGGAAASPLAFPEGCSRWCIL